MNPFTLYSQITLPFHPSPLQPHQKTIITITKRTHVLKPALPYLTRFNHRQNPISKVVRSSMGNDKVLEGKNAALLVNTCITRNLPPALSLEQGLDRIKEAVEELRANPPSCSSGMYKFQLAVPPSAKALNWFCSQPEASKVFPLFFLSSEKENPTYKSLSLGRTRGVFGIGSAVSFKGSSPDASRKHNAIQRYLPAQTTSSKAYGFLDIEFDTKMSNIKHQSGSFYLLIPHIELDEFDDISFLVATLAWDGSSMCTFSEAVQTFEISFDQARHSCVNFSPLIHSSLPKFNNAEDHRQMVRINALLLEGKHFDTSTLEQGDASSVCSQFSARLSPTLSIGNNMKDEISQASYFTQDCPNINALWASLIVEECVRLGLTYFCVAPGSRSSPLTIAAASHPLTTCIACIDERSLAFHALGYAKGSQKPAVIITSSGTAVSNLFPAVVEASQNFVPMLLLTADRPPELVDVGANQAINQVNHYGNFVRHFFSLPPPTDDVSARYVLTTVDSAVFKATSSPLGPIHINCPFREPLANSPRNWNHDCLSGLDGWLSNAEPFTRYIPLQHSLACDNMYGDMAEVLELIQGAEHGILVFGSIQNEDDVWAALLLAKHLLWPVVVDAQSGLRLRKYLSSFLDSKDILFVDQMDQLLLSDSVRAWMKADVIVQIGSRITGRRISQMIERCSPCPYIMVDTHPGRHDPSQIMTHRIQSTISQFSDCLIKCCTPRVSKKWREFIRGLDMMAAWETSFLISSEQSLTEPYVARKLFEAIRCGSALFFGNSMPVRDADMYGSNWVQCTHSASLMFSSGLPCHWVQVTGNRGASGIDGLISTAIGFAVGCNKRVARRADPTEDIAVIQEVRKKVGQHIVLRADANRKWTYDDAIRFASGVKDCSLQYIEEPVNNDEDIVKFCEETGLAVALDETINSIRENHLQVLQKFNHSGVAAVVIKPSVIGGFENAALVARWAQQHRKMTIVSAAFESSLGLSSYIQFARYLDLQNAEMQKLMNKEPELCVAHGFGTYKWFKEDVMVEPLNIRYNPSHSSIEADAADAGRLLQKCQINSDVIVRTFTHEQVREYQLAVETEGVSFSTNVLETGESIDGSTMVFLHGFLGAGRDWTPVMKAMSGSTRCIAVDLPGHGGSKLQYQGNDVSGRPNLSIDVVVDILCKVLSNLTPGKVILVGYSMGARIALYTALKRSDKVERAVIISGSPGLIDNDARATRKAKDDFRASTLVSNGLEFFMQTWYAEELWASFRSHPKFKQVVTNRLQHDDLHTLGKILSDLSIGRQPSLWEDLKTCKVPLQLIVGEKDAKFKAIAREMHTRISHENESSDSPPVVEIPNAGHAVHLENPLAVITAIRQFMKRTKNT
ncbi:protein PHYLLO, chloroplastic [Sesamum angolense]|uniref:Protein PHYLLO, chloroplastic n=1 Tax=Sesamum angolense TaxID=2727404 RepID=A0AAE1XEE5_9LAMI|nr:protein PHYLLO, chloroplastic [Sesamum angolense]